jgi:hypothetical protein
VLSGAPPILLAAAQLARLPELLQPRPEELRVPQVHLQSRRHAAAAAATAAAAIIDAAAVPSKGRVPLGRRLGGSAQLDGVLPLHLGRLPRRHDHERAAVVEAEHARVLRPTHHLVDTHGEGRVHLAPQPPRAAATRRVLHPGVAARRVATRRLAARELPRAQVELAAHDEAHQRAVRLLDVGVEPLLPAD